ncbi:MAG: hypothetical protein HN654_06115 [Candidatus Marinimicrobia bacterium]|mgnify:CR=1 FL=1|nr:hypothetical protein [Candidatus Neomarinimicrobiota bacterium]MBT3848643.1 hypothetical protein [Candidatus Neomarinimicrobiota bacterium]MBT4055336.1 hypothetical protein [Candidatus Neomarinimicrobiota bacterium]MBT4369815.1 hypothetical protein [Candidatus Neomarinimicrobiota bacterium]MBT4660510.1 hypothetical protein [Candidatus Neomarinimicrobiota bacterium]
MALDKQKAFLFKQIEIITMVLTKLYFLTEALDYFGHDTGLKDEDTNDDAVKYELWRKGISLDNFQKDKLCVCFFKDRLNHHSRFQPQIKRIFKGGMKENPFVHIQIKDWADHKEIFTKWYFEKFDTSTLSRDSGIDKILDIDQSVIIDSMTINPKPLMEEGNRIWVTYKFNDVYTLPNIKQLTDYRYVDISDYRKEAHRV